MRRFVTAFMVFFLPGCLSTANAQGLKTYSLEEVLEIALARNPALKASGLDVEISEEDIRAKKAVRVPRVNLESGITRYRYPYPVTPIAGSPLGGSAFPEFDETMYDIGVTLTMPVYRGGRITRGVRMAELEKAATEEAFTTDRHNLVFNVSSLYYKILQLERLLEAGEKSVAQVEEHRRVVSEHYGAGSTPHVDLLKTDVELARSRERVLVLKNNIENAYGALKALMGLDEEEFRLKGDAKNNPVHPGLDEGVRTALFRRSEVKEASKRREAAREGVEYVEGKRLPGIDLSARYADRAGADFDFREDWSVGIRLSVPIFDGGLIRSEARSAGLEVRKMEVELRALEIEIRREVKEAYLNLEKAEERISVTEKVIEAAEENLEVESLKYSTGAGTTADVLDAQTALVRAVTDREQALYDRELALLALRRATGEQIN